MSYRNTGYSSLQRHLDSSNSYSNLSTALSSQQTAALSSQLITLQTAITKFSTQHRTKIANSPSFRSHFSQLTSELGVDPLGGGTKGLWDKLGLGDWYFALGVQIVDVCLNKRERSGGFISLDEVIKGVENLRNGGIKMKRLISNEVTEEDIRRAIEVLEPLGCGYALIELNSRNGSGSGAVGGGVGGGRKVIKCSPGGLDKDSLIIIEVANQSNKGFTTREEVINYVTTSTTNNWTEERVDRAFEKALLDDGIVWIDETGSNGVEYWAPALFDFGS